ncbi:hypothetical protein [Methylobacterium haplocladii]|uniref:Uncharacterized protein n=1 Tax=Methylobacterium haplocladii TaxID=1176176 RepID=A0A512IVX2_9HYPH|nr:hypothetical protein [Methylobacterium haplocladii]GEP01845.1 hypothetical protein MHA02_42320 [Methylobacterium haplocladii]GJD86340.1 hypothetical protein HPGCJGGD_4246 [Methylobacterium haplocladii]GLS61067.1 hypothetical protein GCM10007887_37610 [Methylobacterium haplocladii]
MVVLDNRSARTVVYRRKAVQMAGALLACMLRTESPRNNLSPMEHGFAEF